MDIQAIFQKSITIFQDVVNFLCENMTKFLGFLILPLILMAGLSAVIGVVTSFNFPGMFTITTVLTLGFPILASLFAYIFGGYILGKNDLKLAAPTNTTNFLTFFVLYALPTLVLTVLMYVFIITNGAGASLLNPLKYVTFAVYIAIAVAIPYIFPQLVAEDKMDFNKAFADSNKNRFSIAICLVVTNLIIWGFITLLAWLVGLLTSILPAIIAGPVDLFITTALPISIAVCLNVPVVFMTYKQDVSKTSSSTEATA